MTTWTPKTKQSETWTAESGVSGVRAFDPAGFDNGPRFDTRAAGVWASRNKQSEVWVREAAP